MRFTTVLQIKVANDTLSIYYQNVRGLRTKSNEFLAAVLGCNYDIICITETWLNENFYSNEYFPSGYKVFRLDRDSKTTGCERGGGVLIAIRSEISSSEFNHPRSDPTSPSTVEELWVSVQIQHSNVGPTTSNSTSSSLHIICTYIPHGSCHNERLSDLCDRVTEVTNSRPSDTFLILGDFNVSNADWFFDDELTCMNLHTNNNNLSILLADFMNLSSLQQYNSEFNFNGRLLDLVFCNKHCEVLSCDDPLTSIDPHHIALDIRLSTISPLSLRPTTIFKKMFFQADYDEIRSSLSLTNWDLVFSGILDPNLMTEIFYDILNKIIDIHVPTKLINRISKHPPWYNRPLIKLANEKHKFHSKWKRYGNKGDYNTFAMLRKRFKKLERHCYNNYIDYSENMIRINSKHIWTYLKSKKCSLDDIPQTMFYQGKSLSNGQDICNAFNDYFCSVFIESLPNSYSPVLHTNSNNAPTVDINSIKLDEKLILQELLHVDIYKGAGCDGIHPFFISQCASELARPITCIYRHSIDSGQFPSQWKNTFISPIPKNNKKEEITEYRPISKLCIFGKILEKFVTLNLSSLLSNQISNYQHGFLKARSVETNMACFTDFLLGAMDNNKQVDVVYTDFSKAFDKINHDILIKKLMEIGVHGSLLRWIDSYLRNRSQAVCVRGYCSSFLPVPSGVPQGSHLGPLLFSIYLYDIGNYLANTSHLLYADDTKIYREISNINDCNALQSDLSCLSDYCFQNQLFLNENKCHVISYTRKKNYIHHRYSINNQFLVRVASTRDLGILMDDKLSFNLHIDNIVQRAFRNLGFINRISKPFKETLTLKMLYFSLIRSLLEFATIIWSPQYKIHVTRIEKVQMKFVKLLNFRNSHTMSYDHSLKHYNMLSLNNRRILLDMSFLHKLLNNKINCPDLLEKIPFITRSRSLIRTPRNLTLLNQYSNMFAPPRAKRNYTENRFVIRSTKFYNKNFSEIDIFNTSLNNFKKSILEKLEIMT